MFKPTQLKQEFKQESKKEIKVSGMPYDENTELAMVSLMLKHKDNIIESLTLSSEEFYGDDSLALYESAKSLFDDKKFVDVNTVTDRAKTLGYKIDIEKVKEIYEIKAHNANISDYMEVLKLKSLERKLIQSHNKMGEIVHDYNTPVVERIAQSSNALSSLSYKLDDKTTNAMDVLDEVIADAEDGYNNPVEKTLMYGFHNIDEATGGIAVGLQLIAANTGMGKTAFVDVVADYNALNGFKVLFFSAEMSSKELMYRKIQRYLGIPVNRIRRKQLDRREIDRIRDFKNKLSSNLFINDIGDMEITKLKSLSHVHKAKFGLDLIIVDYLQLLHCKGKKNKYEEVSEISRQLKALSKELNVPVVALAQLNRNNQGRDTKKPVPSDLRDSGAIEQDSDTIMFIHRDDYFDPSTPRKGIVDFIIAKNRYGEKGSYLLKFIPERTDFVEHTPSYIKPKYEEDTEFEGFDCENDDDFLKLRK